MARKQAVVVTCSTRAASGAYEDTTGPRIVEALRSWGFDVADPQIVPDGPQIEDALRDALRAGADVVVTSGGTGIAPGDATPEYTRRVTDYEIPGLAERMRTRGVDAGVPTAVLSRGVAGIASSRTQAGRSLVVNLPGSVGGVKDGLAVLEPVIHHLLDQLAGGDHEREAAS